MRLGAVVVFLSTLFAIGSACLQDGDSREIRIAAAANFKQPAAELVRIFQEETGRNVTLTTGSTGSLYAQIENGAPFAVFLSADSERAEKLESAMPAASGTRFTYAVGKLVLWSPKKGMVDDLGTVLNGEFNKLAIANPKLAPYGKAAEEVLRKMEIWDKVKGRIVRGENVGQTFQFVSTGNADIGFVSLSQVKGKGGSFWLVPQELYTPIEQQAVFLSEDEGAIEFRDFLRSERAKEVIRSYGYDTR
ncbi:MAG: molybdate ABC transporter substrate-binding protein [Acidobacteria bacterium]|nr:MAG: molybdate ABC transporter substrate-binding protein [Acidobacteriota bacterium]REK04223.1 MAG: molybdate ABC transporter substrate-binding protein [Acidobacteriota bacterium]REK15484.1 MAG: molybdate ABC transporter substrate-binding protein [Acidobacteriota bacterium]REK46475.1 MAG: molybdate ABC transporter substrate-binding protein [Acidobacteriota bacterium]